jgi:transcription elongation factor GreA
METVYLTREGLEKLRKDLEHLLREVRPAATESLASARALGDLSENAEYHAAKENLAAIDRRIGTLQTQLTRVHIIDESALANDEIRILTRVRLLDLDRQTEATYTLVDPLQANPAQDLISIKSPIGRGLLGKRKGDEVSISIPSGSLRLRVLDFERSHGL